MFFVLNNRLGKCCKDIIHENIFIIDAFETKKEKNKAFFFIIINVDNGYKRFSRVRNKTSSSSGGITATIGSNG